MDFCFLSVFLCLCYWMLLCYAHISFLVCILEYASSIQFNILFGLKSFPRNTIQIHTYTQESIEHKYKQYENIYRSVAQQSCGVKNPLSTNLHHLSVREKDYLIHRGLINTSIPSLWNWGIYQWSERMCNKEHKSKPFSPFIFIGSGRVSATDKFFV